MFNVASYLHAADVAVDVRGLGRLVVDIAYGGNYYAVVEPQESWPGLGGMLASLSRSLREALIGLSATRPMKTSTLISRFAFQRSSGQGLLCGFRRAQSRRSTASALPISCRQGGRPCRRPRQQMVIWQARLSCSRLPQDRIEGLGDQNLCERPIDKSQRLGTLDGLAVSDTRLLYGQWCRGARRTNTQRSSRSLTSLGTRR